MATNYVKFFRGSSEVFKTVSKNSDTLYFITDSDTNKLSLYLGGKSIVSGVNSFKDLEDLALVELKNKDIFVYDETEQKWINQSIIQAIGYMTGADADNDGGMGLVPAPGAGEQNYFLRGDGIWAPISKNEIEINSDNKSIEFIDNTIAIKDFGKKYYKFIPATENEIAHYEIQEVNDFNPWKEGLEPKVVKENNELVIGWFEPNTDIIDGVADAITNIQSNISNIESILGKPAEEDSSATGLYAKADADKVYTKEETQSLINQEIAKYDHLSRKTFESLDKALEFVAQASDPESYIYMIAKAETTDKDGYDEYLYVNGNLELVGSWNVDLSDYATKEELSTKVDLIEGYELVLKTKIEKLSTIEEGAQKNIINSVNGEFIISNGELSLNEISTSKVINLENILNNKASVSEMQAVAGQIEILSDTVSTLSQKVGSLENLFDSYVKKDEYESELETIYESIRWNEWEQ